MSIPRYQVECRPDDGKQHQWYLEFCFDDGDYDYYENFGTAAEMLEWVFWYMDYRTFISKITIWRDRIGWGKVCR